MKWKVTMWQEKYIDCDEKTLKIERNEETFECPFEYFQEVWYAYQEHRLFRKDRWVVVRSRVTEVWATNCFGIGLENGRHVPESWFDRLFTDKDSAIDFCIKKNMQHKVKVYNW